MDENSLFEHQNFEDVIIQEEQFFSKYFDECTFKNCDFTNSIFEDCSFTNCKFENCNLSLVKIPLCRFDNIKFSNCKMIGIDWTTPIWRKSTKKKPNKFTLSFEGCTLNYSIFIELQLYKAQFINCIAKEVCFENSDMQSSDFSGTDLDCAIFNDCDLIEADFSKALNYNINVCNNKIKNAKFSFPEAISLLHSLQIKIVEPFD